MEKWAYRAGRSIMDTAENINEKLKKLKDHTRETPVFDPAFQKNVVPEAAAAELKPVPDRKAAVSTDKSQAPQTSANPNPYGIEQAAWDKLPSWEKARIIAFNGEYTPGQESVPVSQISMPGQDRTPGRQVANTTSRNVPNRQTPQVDPMRIEEIRGMDLTRRDMGDNPFGRIPGYEENRARVYDSMGRKTYDSDTWVSDFINNNLNRSTELGVADRQAAASKYSADKSAEASQYSVDNAKSAQAQDPLKREQITQDIISDRLNTFNSFGDKTPEELQAESNRIRLDIQHRTDPQSVQTITNPQTGQQAYRTKDGRLFDKSTGQEIRRQAAPGGDAQSSVTPDFNPIAQMGQQQYNTQNMVQADRQKIAANRNRIQSWMDDWQGRSEWRVS